MRIAVFGLGYVGSVTSVCLAMNGHDVWGVDPHAVKVEWIAKGIPPIREPEFAERLMTVLHAGRLHATTDAAVAVRETDVAMICVGTPTTDAGACDLGALGHVLDDITAALAAHPHPYLIAVRSTIPPGTMETFVVPRVRSGAARARGDELRVCFNPEFLREGTAIRDFFEPPFTVFGIDETAAGADHVVSDMEVAYGLAQVRTIRLNFKEAELVKVICNAFHALKIDFANEVGSVAARVGADPVRLMEAFCLDTKLNASAKYLRPGFAFGGSCLPKDVRGLLHVAHGHGLSLPLVESILPSNRSHLQRAFHAVMSRPGRIVGLAGLVFKADTDDVRESPAVALARQLIDAGRDVLLYEPEIRLDRLIGVNLAYLEHYLPEFRTCLVDWPTLARRAETVVSTREGILSAEMRRQLSAAPISLTDLQQL